MELLPKSLQVVLPGALARYLPVLLLNQHLEDGVLSGLSLLKQIAHGILGLALGLPVFHVIIVMFGAPVVDLWERTLLLAVLLSSCVTMPLALHFGCDPRKWQDLLLELSVNNKEELYLVCSSFGALVGVYVGALPIPLDWDRPWQQWPLTCVYGTLFGHAAGIVTSVVLEAKSKTFTAKTAKKD
ncbi:Protein kinase [Phytophthora megakarya]|uniref:Protein kinase n=1 Tax=Phytophthora megakarya TaxID=4795 RepID=A0A225VFX3_9STRA|nr:Protein kinase [Phytophthora megakarya]